MGNSQSVLKAHGYTLVNVQKKMITVKDEGGDQFVIKKLKADQDDVSNFIQQLNHPHVAKHKEIIRGRGCLYLVLEHCKGGDLAQKIKHKREGTITFSETEVLDWTVKICTALTHLHDQQILHKNLQPKSIFFTASGNIRLGEFREINEWSTDAQKTGTEALSYIAPENLSGKPYDEKSEIWRLGCVIYEMCMLKCTLSFTGRTTDEIITKILASSCEALPETFSQDLCQLVKDTLQTDPANRPTVREISMRPFIVKHFYGKNLKTIEDLDTTLHELICMAHDLQSVHFEKTKRRKWKKCFKLKKCK